MVRRPIGGGPWNALALMTSAVFAGSIAAATQNGEPTVNPKVVQQEAFTMIGIPVRTSNAKESTDSNIGRQWTRLMRENLLATIPNRADGNVVAVYTDYASDKDGEYTYVLGARVTNAQNIPSGMVAKTVPAGKYAVFTSEKGPVQKVVVATWMKIWATPKTAPGGDRAYNTDFESYDQRAQDPSDSVMEIHIGIR